MTANYSLSASEEILGQVLKDYANREDVVPATKFSVLPAMFDGVNAKIITQSCFAILQVENSQRLQTDYIDLYIIHHKLGLYYSDRRKQWKC